MNPEIRLFAGGSVYEGWTSLEAAVSMDAIAGEFSLSAVRPEGVEIEPGAEASLVIDGQTLIDGYIWSDNLSISAKGEKITVRGGDKAGDLAECSAVHTPDEWFGLDLCEIAQKVCAPFDVGVKPLTDVGEPFKAFKVQPGETAFELLDRAAKARAVLVTSDTSGNIALTRAGDAGKAGSLIYGQNILSAERSYDMSRRYSVYTVKNQTPLYETGAEETNAVGESSDRGVTRYRPLLMVVQNSETGVSVHELAAWEASVRAGMAAVLDVTVEGFTDENGELWRKNALSFVRIPRWGIEDVLLIKEIRFTLDDKNGALTRLKLVRPDAYKRLPVMPKTKDAGGLLPPDAIEIK